MMAGATARATPDCGEEEALSFEGHPDDMVINIEDLMLDWDESDDDEDGDEDEEDTSTDLQ
jgi:hypothetical protein